VVKVTMVKEALSAFSEQLHKFADANAFALRIAQSSPDATDILVQMWREDIKGVGVNSSEAGAPELTYDIAFYRNCNDDVPEWAFENIVTELHTTLSGVQGVTSLKSQQ
jgi:hypothetical protein